jgi:predicted O-methyltransferase YrrM
MKSRSVQIRRGTAIGAAIAALAACSPASQPDPGGAELVAAEPATPANPRAEAVLRELEGNRGMAVSRSEGQLLHNLVKEIGAKAVVEIGTYRGYSGTWIALALRETGGHLTTYEIDPAYAAIARENYRRAGVDDLVTIVLGDAHVELPKSTGAVDLAFIDADKEGYLDYLEKLLPRVRVGGLIVADNANMSGAENFREAVVNNKALNTRFASDGKMSISTKLR